MKTRFFIAMTLWAIALAGSVEAADWGDLTLTLTYDGKAPAPKPLTVNKDQAVCDKNKAALVDETLVVNKANGGIADVFVYLRPAMGAKVAIHPDYDSLAKQAVELDNKGCRFEPHAAVLWTKQKLVLKNSDPIGHNTKIDVLANPAINPILPANGSQDQVFKNEERLPASVSCSIHPWMTAKLLIRDNPYAVASDKDGKVTIKNLPVGKWEFQIWHEKSGFVQKGAKDAKGTTVKWEKGRAVWEIKKGANDLGTFKVDPKNFEEKK